MQRRFPTVPAAYFPPWVFLNVPIRRPYGERGTEYTSKAFLLPFKPETRM